MTGCRKIIYLFLLAAVFSCKTKVSNEPDCTRLRTGRYEYRSPIQNGRISIQRNDTLQVETESNTGIGMTFRINWLSSCVYTLKFLSSTRAEYDDKILKNKAPLVGKTTITKITSNYYICTTTTDGRSQDKVDTILIIK